MLNLDELKESVKNKISLHKDICKIAAKNGQLDCLIFLHEENFSWDERAFTLAARNGHLKCLKYLYEKKCPYDKEEICKLVVEYGHLECLIFAHENGFPWDEFKICNKATKYGKFDCLKYLTEKGCLLNEKTFINAAKFGNLQILNWLVENNCKISTSADVYEYAAEKNNVEMMEWFFSKGCVFSDEIFKISFKDSSELMKEWLRGKGFELPESDEEDDEGEDFEYEDSEQEEEEEKEEIKFKKTDEVADNLEIFSTCEICLENKKKVAFKSCGHVSCWSCSKKINNRCPQCRKKISGFLPIFF
jgi:Ran GTPase-activating protein (RanGAP) involved in mRNA processing and transport